MAAQKHEAFDLIVQRGRFGLSKGISNPLHHFYHLRHMWSLLAEGGQIITETTTLDRDILEKYHILEAWQREGIHVQPVNYGLLFQKRHQTPKEISLNFQVDRQTTRLWYDLSLDR